MQRNAASVKAPGRPVPKPVVITVNINGHPARALLDSGSLGDFISTTLADQLKLNKENLEVPLGLQLAVQGSRSKINSRAKAKFQYQEITEDRYFDIINLSYYDIILGTPWLFQHGVCLGFNPGRVLIGSDKSLLIHGKSVSSIASRAMTISQSEIDRAREELITYADPLCKSASETGLPPFRAINHKIPLIDDKKIYPWRPSRCPEIFREQWAEKRDAYLRTGRWKVTTSGNTVPMLLIPKPRVPGGPLLLRTVVDLRARNDNTVKQTSPLPDPEGILRRAAAHPFRSLMDGKDAYEQIRIDSDHVDRTAVTTPDGNMVSLVVQIGDCNAPATYQALMNHIFSGYIGRFMDIYLDDIVVYSNNLADHIKYVKLIIDILAREKLYLSKNKLHFLKSELKILGRIISSGGIRMDPDKVDTVLNWKTPTNCDLLRGFLGSVGYLAGDIPGVRIPMAVLHGLTGDAVSFRWGFTEQRAFEDVKTLTQTTRDHDRVPLNYEKTALPVWMVTDGCSTGVAGLVSQGEDWRTAKVAAFYSAKLNPAQQNYPVHEIEMLAGVKTMLRHRDILQGARFKWITDHKGLIHLLRQKNLSGRQARWCEKISEFDFDIVYVPGTENVVADALSRMYSNDSGGTIRAESEYTYFDVVNDDADIGTLNDVTIPILAGIDALVAVQKKPRAPRKKPEPAESGRPETSKEFAARVKGNFALRGPRQRKEGEVEQQNQEIPENPATEIRSEADKTSSDEPESRNGDNEDTGGALNNDYSASLLSVISQSEQGINLEEELRNQYSQDSFFKHLIEKPQQFKNFVVINGLMYLRSGGRNLLCIPKVLIKGNSAREIVISEAHSLLAHLGTHKTLTYLRDQVWWKDMASDTSAYCTTCITCKRSKPSNKKPFGLLNPLPVPGTPWEAIGIDFVGPLPESKNRDGLFDSITVVICLLTAMVHLVPSRINYNARQIAELVFEHIYKLHGLPKHIISDRDVLFTSAFWTRLNHLIGSKLKMSSAYHPETDGSTERANRTITQMLRQCVDSKQTDWVSKLPSIEFALNSARSESTGYAPFFLNTGRMPRSMIWNSPAEDEYPSVRNFAQQRKFAIIAAHDSILAARIKQTRDANKHRRLAPFQEKDLVYISTKNISFPKGLARKLIPKYIGPYTVLQDFGNQSFEIELPPHLKQRGVHNVFHAALLRAYIPNDDRLFPGRLFTQLNAGNENEPEWAVDKILSHSGSSQDAVFEVLWKAGDITWLPYLQIEHLNALKEYLDLQGVENINILPAGKGNPPHQDPQVFLGAMSPFASPQDYKTTPCTWCNPKTSLSNPVSTTLATGHPSYCSKMASLTQPAQAPVNDNNSPLINGLLAPLADLNIPISFADPDSLMNYTVPPPSPEVDEITTLDTCFLAPDAMACDLQVATRTSLLFAESTGDPVPLVKLPSTVSSVTHGMNPSQMKSIVESAVFLLGDTIQVAVRDAVSALNLPGRDTVTSDAHSVSAVPVAASVPVTTFVPTTPLALNAPVGFTPSPMITDDNGFNNVSYNFNFNNTYATIDHPNLRRTSYTIFKFEDPNSPSAQLFHAGQIFLFCSASSRIIDNKFRILTMPAEYLTFALAFNRTARLSPKRFATYDIQTKAPIIPSDPINILDFELDQDLIRSLDRTYPRSGFSFHDEPRDKKSVTFRRPIAMKIHKRADTPYPRSAFRKPSDSAGGYRD